VVGRFCGVDFVGQTSLRPGIAESGRGLIWDSLLRDSCREDLRIHPGELKIGCPIFGLYADKHTWRGGSSG
jgi:hypothetical protein